MDPFLGQITLPYNFAPKNWALCEGQVADQPEHSFVLAARRSVRRRRPDEFRAAGSARASADRAGARAGAVGLHHRQPAGRGKCHADHRNHTASFARVSSFRLRGDDQCAEWRLPAEGQGGGRGGFTVNAYAAPGAAVSLAPGQVAPGGGRRAAAQQSSALSDFELVHCAAGNFPSAQLGPIEQARRGVGVRDHGGAISARSKPFRSILRRKAGRFAPDSFCRSIRTRRCSRCSAPVWRQRHDQFRAARSARTRRQRIRSGTGPRELCPRADWRPGVPYPDPERDGGRRPQPCHRCDEQRDDRRHERAEPRGNTGKRLFEPDGLSGGEYLRPSPADDRHGVARARWRTAAREPHAFPSRSTIASRSRESFPRATEAGSRGVQLKTI